MKPLIVLLLVFVFALFGTKIFRGIYDFSFSGRVAMSGMLVFTAVGHFVFTKGMTMMLPEFIPFKKEAVYLTGIIEIVFAIGLFLPNLRLISALLLIAFFILVFPANIFAAVKHIDYQKGTFDGNDLTYLWFRLPLQILFIVWTYLSGIKFG
ncbi:hypothetical protein ACFFLS_12060 [Flavobacterium procerum]|uniref:DoxX family membrane protein n=1 Tax=Flavobacterium procerum TaxID=1455569 RepID=A0ABV6BQR9_9FLAO